MDKKAKESSQIARARKKIEKQLLASEKEINSEALGRMRELIGQQIKRHSRERISLKQRQFVLFDENQNPAKTESKFIFKLLEEIKKGEKMKVRLKGRVIPIKQKRSH